MKYFFSRLNQKCHIAKLALNKGATSRCEVQVLPSLHLHPMHLALLSNLNLISRSSWLQRLLAWTTPLLHTWYWPICWKEVVSPPTATSATMAKEYNQELETIQAGTHICTIHPSLDGHRQYFSRCFVTGKRWISNRFETVATYLHTEACFQRVLAL